MPDFQDFFFYRTVRARSISLVHNTFDVTRFLGFELLVHKGVLPKSGERLTGFTRIAHYQSIFYLIFKIFDYIERQ